MNFVYLLSQTKRVIAVLFWFYNHTKGVDDAAIIVCPLFLWQ